MKNDFKHSDKRLQEKLEGFRMTAPEGAWAGIEQNIGGKSGGRGRFFYLWMALLFVGISGIGIFTFMYTNTDNAENAAQTSVVTSNSSSSNTTENTNTTTNNSRKTTNSTNEKENSDDINASPSNSEDVHSAGSSLNSNQPLVSYQNSSVSRTNEGVPSAVSSSYSNSNSNTASNCTTSNAAQTSSNTSGNNSNSALGDYANPNGATTSKASNSNTALETSNISNNGTNATSEVPTIADNSNSSTTNQTEATTNTPASTTQNGSTSSSQNTNTSETNHGVTESKTASKNAQKASSENTTEANEEEIAENLVEELDTSLVENPELNEANLGDLIEDEKVKPLWSIEGGVDASTFSINHGSNNTGLQQFLNDSYSRSISQGAFLRVNYQPWKRVSFHTGMEYAQNDATQDYSFTITNISTEYDTVGFFFDSMTQQQVPIIDTLAVPVDSLVAGQFQHRVSQVYIPFGAMFHIPLNSKSELGINLSGLVGIRTRNTGDVLLDQNGNSIAAADAYRQMNFSARAAFRYSYYFGSRAGLYIEPYVGFGLNDRSNTTLPFSSRFRNSGIRVGFRYNF